MQAALTPSAGSTSWSTTPASSATRRSTRWTGAIDAVIDVHLKGALLVQPARLPLMRDQGYGRIINTSSASGLFGNFGQANYGAAKAGLAGLTRVLAMEGAGHGITVNAIAPIAATRMTADLLGELGDPRLPGDGEPAGGIPRARGVRGQRQRLLRRRRPHRADRGRRDPRDRAAREHHGVDPGPPRPDRGERRGRPPRTDSLDAETMIIAKALANG